MQKIQQKKSDSQECRLIIKYIENNALIGMTQISHRLIGNWLKKIPTKDFEINNILQKIYIELFCSDSFSVTNQVTQMKQKNSDPIIMLMWKYCNQIS